MSCSVKIRLVFAFALSSLILCRHVVRHYLLGLGPEKFQADRKYNLEKLFYQNSYRLMFFVQLSKSLPGFSCWMFTRNR